MAEAVAMRPAADRAFLHEPRLRVTEEDFHALLEGFRTLRKAEARVARVEARLMAWLSQGGRVHRLSFRSVADLGRELLACSESTVRNRVGLDRALSSCEEAERAFLDGELTSCQVLALAPMLGDPDASGWIRLAKQTTVRELRARVKEKKPWTASDEEDRRSTFAFWAPAAVAAKLDEHFRVAQKVIGYDAPAAECVAAALAETGRSGRGVVEAERKHRRAERQRPVALSTHDPSTDRRFDPKRDPHARLARISAIDLVELRRVLQELAHYADNLDADLPAGEPESAFHAYDLLRALRVRRNSTRVLLTRLLRSMRRTGGYRVLGFERLEDFVEDALGMSQRTARELVAESYLFEDYPKLQQEYAAGHIGISKAYWIRRMARTSPGNDGDIDPWIARARQVMTRNFQGECRVLELLRCCDRHLGAQFSGPFPHTDLDEGIIKHLRRFGWTDARLEEEIKRRGLKNRVPNASRDPAKNPHHLRRLEALVGLLANEVYTEVPPLAASPDPTSPKNRQTFAGGEGQIRVRITGPAPTIADLRALQHDFRRTYGPTWPTWTPIHLLFRDATDQWNLKDPGRPLTRESILLRDDHHCTFPGCPSRGPLESHHAEFRSHGGRDTQANQTELCSTHHRAVVHEGHARITGQAPHALRFEFGRRAKGHPILTTVGGFIVDEA